MGNFRDSRPQMCDECVEHQERKCQSGEDSDATVLKSNANIQDEDAAPRREDAVVEARFLGVEK